MGDVLRGKVLYVNKLSRNDPLMEYNKTNRLKFWNVQFPADDVIDAICKFASQMDKNQSNHIQFYRSSGSMTLRKKNGIK